MAVIFALLSCCLIGLAASSTADEGVNLMAAIRHGHPRIRYTTRTSIITETIFATVAPTVNCAKLVNVTGPCQQLRGNREDPVVLTFDDDMDDIGDLRSIQPSKTLRIETTQKPDERDISPSFVLEASSEHYEDDTAEARFKLPSVQLPKLNLFNAVVVHKTTERITSTVFVPTKTNVVFVMNCTPFPFTAMPICLPGSRMRAARNV